MSRANLACLLAILLPGLVSAAAAAEEPDPSCVAPGVTRTIDAAKSFRRFPDLVGYRNTSIQKAPAPALARRSEEEYGRAKVTRCWLNLDEMWDYRTGRYEYNYRIGAPKYDDVAEKFRESWGWVTETDVRFDDYLGAFGRHSDTVMLTVRRYERDVLDGKLGVTMEDWKTIFKAAVRHAKQVCPNLRYVEVCNEYGCAGFIGCTPDEYYGFYRLAYQAVNEVNAELELAGDDRVLVGGPNVVRDAMAGLNRFFEKFGRDASPDKRLDFVTWHEYHNRYAELAHREAQVKLMLAAHGLPENLPLFITEHAPYHPKAGSAEYNRINGAALVKSLYFASLHGPGVKILPWVHYHDRDIQTRIMWFDGPNQPDTRADELRMLPAGCSMKLLSMHREWEIAVDNAVDDDQIVLASVDSDGLAVEAVNYGPPRDVRIQVENLPKVFTALGDGELRVATYLIDLEHGNCVANPGHPGGIEKVADDRVAPAAGAITLAQPALSTSGIVFWEVVPPKVGAALNSPVSVAPAEAPGRSSPFDGAAALKNAAATPDAHVEQDGSTV
jgi:hypothetical protein